ncbi:GDSL-type esterase/lipase family protein [Desulfogranum mediterraneum]|uniref:GDSL-type esterase/lipase family protein n=1 Tax=Desulfogranum mediterraneum TaxID=160661 RepID=UPI000415402B|nr:GDSL-type esterase/lipase family protein [Desulfogranum mediterraneum]
MKTILMLGDSLLEWGDWERLLPEFKVNNRGMAGESCEGLAGRLIGELSEAEVPQAILLQSGTNNLLMGSPHFPAIFATMVPTIRAFFAEPPIIISSLMPMPIVPSHVLAEVNDQLREISQQTENCIFLDMVPPFNERCLPITHPGFLNDQVHLSTRGYLVWAEEIKACLKKVLD